MNLFRALLTVSGFTLLSRVTGLARETLIARAFGARNVSLADARPADLTKLMSLPNLESVFSQLVQQQDTRAIAEKMVEVMQIVSA